MLLKNWLIKILLCFIFAGLSILSHAYRWPFNSQETDTTTYRIDETLGNYRNDPWHLHTGVDINKEGGDLGDNGKVYSINCGKFLREIDTDKPNNEKVTISTIDAKGNTTGHYFIYVHVNGLAYGFQKDDIVNSGTAIAKCKDLGGGASHLHLVERGDQRFYNPLRLDGGLNNFSDSRVPKILYWKKPGTEYQEVKKELIYHTDLNPSKSGLLLPNKLKGHVDIQVPAYDTAYTLAGSSIPFIGIYGIQYSILKDGNTVTAHKAFEFDDMPWTTDKKQIKQWVRGNIHRGAVGANEYLYYATNDPFIVDNVQEGGNSYWNTKQKSGNLLRKVKRKQLNAVTGIYEDVEVDEESNTVDAVANIEAKYPDGKYNLIVSVYDIRANTVTTYKDITIDNYEKPFIRSLAILQGAGTDTPKYQAEITSNTITVCNSPQSNTPLAISNAVVKIVFSEEMNTPLAPILRFSLPQTEITLTTTSTTTTAFSNDTWLCKLVIKANTTTAIADSFSLSITAAMDTAGNTIPATFFPGIHVDAKSLTINTWGFSEFYHCSPKVDMIGVDITGNRPGVYNIETVFKAGQRSIYSKTLNYKLPDKKLVDAAGNTVAVENVRVQPGGQLVYQWNGIDESGTHVYSDNIRAEIKVKSQAGNQALDNHVSFKIVGDKPETNDPNDPGGNETRRVESQLACANKTLFIPCNFSMGGIEFSGLKDLFGQFSLDPGNLKFNVDFRTVDFFGDAKWGSPDDQVAAIKKQVDAFAANEIDRVTIVAWGQAGILAEKYLQEHTPVDKVAKLITISTPVKGINSLPMALQSYALTLMFKPAIQYLNDSGALTWLDDITSLGGKGKHLSFISMLRSVNRNDLVINPLNFLGEFLGRTGYAKNFQADSSLMKELGDFNPNDMGIGTASVTTALWPDMPPGVQLGICAAVGGLGFLGVYSDVELFNLNSPDYNNLNEELTEILANLVEKELNQILFNPIKTRINEELREIDKKYLFSDWQTQVDLPNIRTNLDLKTKLAAFANTNVALTPDLQKVLQDINGAINNFKTYLDHPLTGEPGQQVAKLIGDSGKDKVDQLLGQAIGVVIGPEQRQGIENILNMSNQIQTSLSPLMTNELGKLNIPDDATNTINAVYIKEKAESYFTAIEHYRKMPIEYINEKLDKILREDIQAPLRQEIEARIKTMLPIIKIPGVSLHANIPGSWLGMGIMAGFAILGTDFIKNSDGVSEAKPLLLTKAFGLKCRCRS